MIEMTYHEEGNGYEKGDHETQIIGGRGWAEAVMGYPLVVKHRVLLLTPEGVQQIWPRFPHIHP